MKLIFSILFILILKLNGLAQSIEFFKTYDFGSTNYPIFLNLIDFNNEIFVNGSTYNPNLKILLLKADYLGNIIDTAIYGTDTGKYFIENFIPLQNNKLLVLTQHVNLTSNMWRQYMLYIDTNLVRYNDSIYSQKYSQLFGNCKINNSYYFTGATWYNDNGDSLPNSNIMFWKTDTNFITISTKSIGTVNSEGVNRIMIGFDDNLLLGGISVPDGSHEKWYLVNTDTTGQVLGQYFYGTLNQSDNDGIRSLSLSSDSCYFISGIFYQYDTGLFHYYWASAVVKVDRQFNTIWTKNIGTTIPSVTVSKIISTFDGNQVLLTQRSPVIEDNSIYSQVTKFNNNGNILWSRDYYQGDTTQYIRYRAWDIIETNDKGFAFCGSAIDTTNMGPNMEAWLVKTDSLGCDGFHSCDDTTLVCTILQASDTVCKNDTTWLHVKFKGRSAPYFVYANTTLALDSIYYPNTLPLWIDTLVPYKPTTLGLQQVIIKVKDPWGWNQSDTVQMFVKNCGAGVLEEAWYPKKVEIFPNPANNELHVKIRTAINSPVSITIYNMQGELVQQITTKQSATGGESIIDVSGLEQGVYGIRVTGTNINITERFVKL
ncbi:MAG: T9SS type A sorting domain-containing protein [Bacteroidia bacterium]|nr:T9SS type A sorting domain-containing protein [Bacteroidia bacterium]